ncbi:MAG: hypothetical protein PHE24_01425 [Patescibacteria group bacterium]|nr:hypothetical protein [Patescibacteria group bacterium]
MKIFTIIALSLLFSCSTYLVPDRKIKLSSGLEFSESFIYEGTTYSLDKRYQKALKPIALFPEANILLSGVDRLVDDLDHHQSEEMTKNFYLKVRNREKYEQAIFELADKYGKGRKLNELNAREALVLIAQIVRGQLADTGAVDSLIGKEINELFRVLETRKNFHVSIFEVMSFDEYFLAGYKNAGYRCGMVSWNAIYIFDLLQAYIPALADVRIYECGTRGPAHSFNLLLSRQGDRVGVYLIDFQKEKFWESKLEMMPLPWEMVNQLDMSDIGISRLGR